MEKFKSFTQDGVTAELWSYDSLLVGARWAAFDALFDVTSPLGNSPVFREFRILCVYVNTFTFEDALTEKWAIALREWWKDVAPLVRNGRFDEAWELFCALDNSAQIPIFFMHAWGETRRQFEVAGELITAGAANATDADFLAVAAPTSKRSRRRT